MSGPFADRRSPTYTFVQECGPTDKCGLNERAQSSVFRRRQRLECIVSRPAPTVLTRQRGDDVLHWTKKVLFGGQGEGISAHSQQATVAEYLWDSAQGLAIHQAVASLLADFGPVEERASRRKISFRRHRGFAFLWCPGQYLRRQMPVVLSIALPWEVRSPRFRHVAHPLAAVWIHHLELPDASAIDSDVVSWLREAYDAAR